MDCISLHLLKMYMDLKEMWRALGGTGLICGISGSDSADCECKAVWSVGSQFDFWRNTSASTFRPDE
jgi:hypothetical protein